MSINVRAEGMERLQEALSTLSQYRAEAVMLKQATEILNRARKNATTTRGGTPIDTGELRISASMSEVPGGYNVGYTSEYAPHVEYGHRQEVGRYVPAIGKRLVKSWVPGQYFLRKNVQQQEPIFKEDLRKALEKEVGGK